MAAGQIDNVMKLCFLMEKQYAPYSKWLGTAFAQLDCGPRLIPLFEAVFAAKSWVDRQAPLSAVYEYMAHWHDELGLTSPLPASVSNFHDRPYQVIHAANFVDAIRATIQDEDVLALPAHLGGVDQFVDSTDVLSYPKTFGSLRSFYGRGEES